MTRPPMPSCPACSTPLVRDDDVQSHVLRCPGCDGSAVTLPVLRQAMPRHRTDELFLKIRDSSLPAARTCPACRGGMRSLTVGEPDAQVELDACRTCVLLWFDASEKERLGVVLARKAAPDVRRAVAALELETSRDAREVAARTDDYRRFFEAFMDVWDRLTYRL